MTTSSLVAVNEPVVRAARCRAMVRACYTMWQDNNEPAAEDRLDLALAEYWAALGGLQAWPLDEPRPEPAEGAERYVVVATLIAAIERDMNMYETTLAMLTRENRPKKPRHLDDEGLPETIRL